MLLLIGSGLSYLLIPWISEKSTHKRVLQEGRVSEARYVLNQALVDDKQLNTILTTFEMFDKEAASDPKNYKSAQTQLKRTITDLYIEFDRHAWWWGHDLTVQCGLLRLPQGSKETIEKLNDDYAKNLVDATKQVDLLRGQFFSKNYAPLDSHNAKALQSARDAFNRLAAGRGDISGQLAGMFMPPELNWQ
jgi:hypothetical protein